MGRMAMARLTHDFERDIRDAAAQHRSSQQEKRPKRNGHQRATTTSAEALDELQLLRRSIALDHDDPDGTEKNCLRRSEQNLKLCLAKNECLRWFRRSNLMSFVLLVVLLCGKGIHEQRRDAPLLRDEESQRLHPAPPPRFCVFLPELFVWWTLGIFYVYSHIVWTFGFPLLNGFLATANGRPDNDGVLSVSAVQTTIGKFLLLMCTLYHLWLSKVLFESFLLKGALPRRDGLASRAALGIFTFSWFAEMMFQRVILQIDFRSPAMHVSPFLSIPSGASFSRITSWKKSFWPTPMTEPCTAAEGKTIAQRTTAEAVGLPGEARWHGVNTAAGISAPATTLMEALRGRPPRV
eukprot:g16817.t1